MSSRFFKRFNLLGDFPKDDLLYAMYPLYKVCRWCGVCPLDIQYQNGRVTGFKLTTRAVLLSVVKLILMTIVFIYAVISLETVHSYTKYEHNIMSIITAWGQVYALYSVAFLGTISSNIKRREKVEVYQILRSIDKRLINLGTSINYTKTRRSLLSAMSVFSSMPLVFSMVNCGVINSNYDAFILCYLFICFWPMLIICLKEFQYYNLMLLVKNKVEEINKHLKYLEKPFMHLFSRERSIHLTKFDSQEKYKIAELKNIAGIYTDLVRVATKIQNIFGLHLLLMISTSFLVLTIQTYHIFALLMKIIQMSAFRIFAAVAWMMVQSFAIVMNIHICSQTSVAMSTTGPLLHNIQSLSENRQVFQTAQMFSLQILHRNVSFTAAGFFNLDYKLITSIVAAVTTYLVIIIQFHIANTQNADKAGFNVKPNATLMP